MTSQFSTSYKTYRMNPIEAKVLRNELSFIQKSRRDISAKIDRSRKAESATKLQAELVAVQAHEARLEALLEQAPVQGIPEEVAVDMMIGQLVSDLALNQKYMDKRVAEFSRTRDYTEIMDDSFLEKGAEADLFMDILVKIEAQMKKRERLQMAETPRVADLATVLKIIVENVQSQLLSSASYLNSNGSGVRAVRERAEISAKAQFVQNKGDRTFHRLAEAAEVWAWMESQNGNQ